MITEKEKKRIIEVLGKHYSNKIIEYLQTKGIVNAKGQAFSQTSIRQIVNGFDGNNKPVELEILKLVDKTERTDQKNAERRKRYIAKVKK